MVRNTPKKDTLCAKEKLDDVCIIADKSIIDKTNEKEDNVDEALAVADRWDKNDRDTSIRNNCDLNDDIRDKEELDEELVCLENDGHVVPQGQNVSAKSSETHNRARNETAKQKTTKRLSNKRQHRQLDPAVQNVQAGSRAVPNGAGHIALVGLSVDAQSSAGARESKKSRHERQNAPAGQSVGPALGEKRDMGHTAPVEQSVNTGTNLITMVDNYGIEYSKSPDVTQRFDNSDDNSEQYSLDMGNKQADMYVCFQTVNSLYTFENCADINLQHIMEQYEKCRTQDPRYTEAVSGYFQEQEVFAELKSGKFNIAENFSCCV